MISGSKVQGDKNQICSCQQCEMARKAMDQLDLQQSNLMSKFHPVNSPITEEEAEECSIQNGDLESSQETISLSSKQAFVMIKRAQLLNTNKLEAKRDESSSDGYLEDDSEDLAEESDNYESSKFRNFI